MSLRKQKQFSQQQNKKTWSKTHHELFQKVSGQGLLRKKVLLMVSGGADSMAALRLWSEVFPERSKFAVFHFHHGSGPQVKFRNQAASFLKKICAAHEIDFFLSENILQDLKTEAAFRKSRYLAARKIMAEHGFELLVTAHHANDLLETRLIRLIRGTSGEGLIAIPELKKDLFRPWLQTSQNKLRQVLLSSPQWGFVEDPTNSDSSANLRNWIRQEWLAQLETIRPGGSFRLAASLESLLSQSQKQTLSKRVYLSIVDLQGMQLDLMKFLICEATIQKKIIARIYLNLDQKNFSTAGLCEVMKQLDKTKDGHTFKVQGLTWQISGRYAMIRTS